MKILKSVHKESFKHTQSKPIERVTYIQEDYPETYFVTNTWSILDDTKNIMVVENINNFL
jgi:hypothetical protein